MGSVRTATVAVWPQESQDYGVFQPSPITLPPERILRVHGYKDPSKVRPAIRAAAVAIGKRAEGLFAPELHYRRLAVAALDGAVLKLEGGIVFHCGAFPRFLADVREVVVVVATMGPDLDRDVIAHMDRFEPLEALFLETCGWLGIEALTKQFSGYLRGLGRGEGFHVSCRMGPGYSYKIGVDVVSWPLEQQEQMFAAFDGIALPVRLMQSCVMLPKMSRTGLFGLAPVH